MHNYKFVTVAAVNTASLRLEVRDNHITACEDLQLSQPDFLLGGLLTQLPFPSQGRYALPGNRGYTNIGEVVFSPANIPWQIRTGDGQFRTVTCVYRADTFHAITHHDGDWRARELSACHDIPDMHMHQVLERLGAEALSPGFASDLLVEAMGTQLLVELARHLQSHRHLERPENDGLEPWQLRRLREYINELDGRQPSLREMAELCRTSTRTLMRRFKATTGESVGSYTQRHRLIRAKGMLESGNMPLKVIAERLGFSSASNFSAAFRRALGMTPGEYRHRTQ